MVILIRFITFNVVPTPVDHADSSSSSSSSICEENHNNDPVATQDDITKQEVAVRISTEEEEDGEKEEEERRKSGLSDAVGRSTKLWATAQKPADVFFCKHIYLSSFDFIQQHTGNIET